jgi:hypothetical protein
VPETPQDAYERGVTAGEIAETLRRHDDHLERINGSTEKTAQALVALNETQQMMALQLQRLADQAESDAKTRVATAAALKDADEARRNQDETWWTPVARSIALLGALVALVGLFVTIYLATGR